MGYNIIIEDKEYTLPNYTISIMEKIERVEAKTNSSATLKEKLKTMYDFVGDVLGKDNRVDALGEFNSADPNIINIAYLSIVKEYNKPLTEYQEQEVQDSIDNMGLEKVSDMMEVLNKVENFKK